MDTNRAMPPQKSDQPRTSSAHSGMDTDLYKAIVGEVKEEEILVSPKKKQTVVMSAVVLFMKITFYFDSVRRTNESLFNFLSGLWRGFMFLIYLGGISTLFLSIYARMRLPLELENFFETHNLKYDSLKMADYSLSRINVINLHDDENKYVIPELNVHSTFADFLQGRIRTVTVDGLRLNLKSTGANEDSLENVLKVLGMVANPMESGLDLKLNYVTINNATLNIEAQGIKIPVNFSVSGGYSNEAQAVIKFNVDEEFLKLDASLAISGTEQKRNLEFTIKSGTLALPNHAPEELQGTVVITTKSDKIDSIKTDLNLNYGYNLKTIQTTLDNSEKGFSGNGTFVIKNTSEKESKALVDLALSLSELKIDKEGTVSTSAPIQMKINRLSRNTTVLEGIEGTLNGDLKCSLPQMECLYDLSQKATVRYQNLAVRYKEQNIFIDESGSLSFLPTKNTLSLQMNSSKIGLNWIISNANLIGYYNVQTNSLEVSADKCYLSGNFSTQVNQDTFDVKVENGFYQTPTLTMKGIQLTATDLYNPTAPIRFNATEVITSSPLLTQPVSLDMIYLNQNVRAGIQVKNTGIKLNLHGVFQPFQKTFSGEFDIPAIELSSIPFPLSDLSSIFSKRINHLSGKMMADGQLQFSGASNISGPLRIALKDVGFRLDNTPVQQLNGVITLSSLVPLASPLREIQYLSIGKIDALAPLTNINASFQLENQSLRLLGASAELGNEKLTLSSALIPYRKPSALLYFKTEKEFEIAKFEPFIRLEGIVPSGGKASLAIPVDVSEKGIVIPSVTLKVNNVTLRQQQNQEDVIGLFKTGNNIYTIYRGQLVYDKAGNLLVDFDGLLMPTKKHEAFSKKDIHLAKPLFKPGTVMPVPEKIKEAQKALFER